VSLIGVAAVLSLIRAFIYYSYKENITSVDRQLLTDPDSMKEIKSPPLSASEQGNYDFAEFGENLKKTMQDTLHDSRNVVSTTSGSDTVHIPYVNVPGINCAALFNGNVSKIVEAHVREVKWPKRHTISDDVYVNAAADCTQYVTKRRFTMQPLSSEEASFPLAYSIVMYRDVELFERLLRAIYRPQNFYCVHVDKNSTPSVHRAVAAVVSCFTNAFIAPRIVGVYWATYTVLEPELICMEALLSFSRKWRYFINLTGQEFPLKTNWGIVKILKVLNGANNIEGTIKRLLSCILHSFLCIFSVYTTKDYKFLAFCFLKVGLTGFCCNLVFLLYISYRATVPFINYDF